MSIYLIGGLAVGSLALIVYALWPKGAEEDKTIQRRIKGDRNASDPAQSLRPPEESVAKRVLKSDIVRNVLVKYASDRQFN